MSERVKQTLINKGGIHLELQPMGLTVSGYGLDWRGTRTRSAGLRKLEKFFREHLPLDLPNDKAEALAVIEAETGHNRKWFAKHVNAFWTGEA